MHNNIVVIKYAFINSGHGSAFFFKLMFYGSKRISIIRLSRLCLVAIGCAVEIGRKTLPSNFDQRCMCVLVWLWSYCSQ